MAVITEAIFRDARANNARFVGTAATGVKFESATVNGADFSNARLEAAEFSKTKMDEAIFRGARANIARFVDVEGRGVNLESAFLNKASFNCSVAGWNFSDSYLVNSDFEQAKDVARANFRDARIADYIYGRLASEYPKGMEKLLEGNATQHGNCCGEYIKLKPKQ
jgi:uncharacterized protein YjbI with pentapeptide repeats